MIGNDWQSKWCVVNFSNTPLMIANKFLIGYIFENLRFIELFNNFGDKVTKAYPKNCFDYWKLQCITKIVYIQEVEVEEVAFDWNEWIILRISFSMANLKSSWMPLLNSGFCIFFYIVVTVVWFGISVVENIDFKFVSDIQNL